MVEIGQSPQPGSENSFSSYESVYSFRYGSPEMREVWSERNRWKHVRQIWLAAARVQNHLGLVSDEELNDLEQHELSLNVGRIFALEKKSGHDVAAAIAEYEEVAPLGARILHQGMTSEDVLSNAEALRIHEGLDIITTKLDTTLLAFADRIDETSDVACMGWTHLQAAEPTTVGYRLARYAQDLLIDKKLIDFMKAEVVKGKGIKGAVGTSASFTHLLEGTGVSPQEHENEIMQELGIDPVLIAGQAYPRKIDMLTVMTLASLGQSLHRFGLDVQILQSSPFAEWAEPRRKGQIGSSAMPHKQNPVNSENIDGITEDLAGKVTSSWMTAAYETLERTLRDSSGKRSWLPESFLIVDEALTRSERIIRGLNIRESVIHRNLNQFGPFSALEVILAESGKRGANRQEIHEVLRELAGQAQDAIWNGDPNPLQELVIENENIRLYIDDGEIKNLFGNVQEHVGDAASRAEQLAQDIRNKVTSKN